MWPDSRSWPARRPGHPAAGGTINTEPELPEVESLAIFLRERATGAEIDWAASTAISVLKTYQPDLSALSGQKVTGTARYGKFLDLISGPEPLHLVMHLAVMRLANADELAFHQAIGQLAERQQPFVLGAVDVKPRWAIKPIAHGLKRGNRRGFDLDNARALLP